MMRIVTLAIVGMTGVLFAAAPASAQIGMPNMNGMGGLQSARPQRKLHRNTTPALSPALNMIPGAANSFGGQFLLRTVPQEQAIRANTLATRNFDRLDSQLKVQEAEIRGGLSKTGHTVGFMNYGRYYHMSGIGGGGRP
jgi:hypothetical protein